MTQTPWLPPRGGPEAPTSPPMWSRPTPPQPRRGRNAGRVAFVLVGVAAVLLGVVAIVAAESMKLDAEKVLTGGMYVKDGFRVVMTGSGVVLAIVGGLLVLLAGLGSNRSAMIATAVAVGVLSVAVVAEGAILVAAVNENERARLQADGLEEEVRPSADEEVADPYGDSLEAAVSEDFRVDAEADCPTNGIDDRTITCTVYANGAEGAVEATLDSSWELVEAYDTEAVQSIVG